MTSLSPESLLILAAARAAVGPVRVRRLVHGLPLSSRLAEIGVRELVASGLVRQLGATRRAMRLEIVPGAGEPELAVSGVEGDGCRTDVVGRDRDAAAAAAAVCGAPTLATTPPPPPRPRYLEEGRKEGTAGRDPGLCGNEVRAWAGPEALNAAAEESGEPL